MDVFGMRTGKADGIVGHGEADFRAACDGLRQWQAHAAFGATVEPVNAPIATGTDVVSKFAIGPVHLVGPCRIIRTFDEPRRFGFEYETRAGHPLRGREEFRLEWLADDSVHFTVEAVSAPSAWFVYAALPAARLLQRHARSVFIDGIAAFVAAQQKAVVG